MKSVFTLALLATLTIPFAGCDATTARAPGNTTLGGAALGGLTGAGIGAAANGSKGALVGGLIGTAGGALVGNQMERNRDAAEQQAYYGAPAPAYGAPAPAYGAPAPAYGAPAAPAAGGSAGYGEPAPGFAAPPPQSF